MNAADTANAIPNGMDESKISLDQNANPMPGTKVKTGPSSIWILIRVVFALAIVCFGVYGVVYFMKKTTVTNASTDPYLKSIASLALSPNKSVQVLSIGSSAYLVGITDQSISLIAEVKDTELIDAMNLEAARKAGQPPANFASVLSSFLPGKLKNPVAKESRDDSVSGLGTADFIRRQRERLKNTAERESREPETGNDSGNKNNNGNV